MDPSLAPFLEDGVERFVEPRQTFQGTWYLGVFGHYTNTGHLLTQVVPNTPASRAGLEPGDRLITVNGHQIGQILGQQFPLDFLLHRYTSPTGHVRLLVQDRRTNRLVNLDVRLKRVQVHY